MGLTGLLGTSSITRTAEQQCGYALVDVDDIVVKLHGYAKQGAGYGYNRIRGLNALLATVSTTTSAPLIVALRLRKGGSALPRGAKRLVADAVKDARRVIGPAVAV